jgi:hypothetical protein
LWLLKINFLIQTNILKNICANFAHMMKSILMTFKILNNKQPTFHEKGTTSYQNIGTTCLIITPSNIIIIIKPSNVIKHQFYYWWKMLTINQHFNDMRLIYKKFIQTQLSIPNVDIKFENKFKTTSYQMFWEFWLNFFIFKNNNVI